jgi:5-formyltetrahydrofolate cyclo-ligase
MPKNRVREKQLKQRRALDLVSHHAASVRAQQRVLELDVFRRADQVALYSPIHGEVDTALLFSRALEAGKSVAFPRVEGGSMAFIATADAHSFAMGCFGVLEPCGTGRVAIDCLQLVVVPGVAFGRCGARLGYGKGFYDQTFEVRPSSCVLVGLGFSFQLEEDLPKEAHDVGLDYIVTDEETLAF